MLNDILNAANLYATGLKNVQDRRDQWLKKHTELKDHLKELADYLTANATYKQGFYVDVLHAFDEHMNGTVASLHPGSCLMNSWLWGFPRDMQHVASLA